jgi:hypothetical protein
MRKVIVMVVIAFSGTMGNSLSAQEPKTIKLEQYPGEFTVKGMILNEGVYIFEITNKGVDHPVGFGLATADEPDVEHALAVVTNGGRGLDDGETDSTEAITLKKGKYVYWCPANPTAQYNLVVE